MIGYDKQGNYRIMVDLGDIATVHYFTPERICDESQILTRTQGVLNYYVEKYNKSYVIISPTKWKMYNETGICDIELVSTSISTGGTLSFFRWTVDEIFKK